MFDVPLHEIVGRHAPQHWVNLAERDRYLDHVLRHGRIDDFEAQMTTSKGRRLWASLSGQRLRIAGEDTLLAAIVDVTARRQAREDLLRAGDARSADRRVQPPPRSKTCCARRSTGPSGTRARSRSR